MILVKMGGYFHEVDPLAPIIREELDCELTLRAQPRIIWVVLSCIETLLIQSGAEAEPIPNHRFRLRRRGGALALIC